MACSSLVDIRGIDRRHVVTVDVDVVGSSEIERIALEIRFEQAQSLGGFSADQLLDRLEIEPRGLGLFRQ